MAKRLGKHLGRGLVLAALTAVGLLLLAWPFYRSIALVRLDPLPAVYERRAGSLTANVQGRFAWTVTEARFRLNDGAWHEVGRGLPRARFPRFIAEIPGSELRPGENRLEIEAQAPGHPDERVERSLRYDPAPPALPRTETWQDASLDVQDGSWQTYRAEDGGWRVRPTPGFEDYDRILLVTGSFPGGRRVETDVVFHEMSRRSPHDDFGFGVLPMWGGHPEPTSFRPRRGWSFGLAWYWQKHYGHGLEFSYRNGDINGGWTNTYREAPVESGQRCRIVVEAWPERTPAGAHVAYRMRLKWWPAGEAEPAAWQELRDVSGAPLPPGEFGVGLLAYYSAVDFGPVTITPLADRVVEPDAAP